MKAIIIDDEALARKTIREITGFSGLEIDIVAEADSVKTGVEAILQHSPDLVLLDIKMPDGTGFDLLKQLPDIKFKLIFITAFEQFAIKAFEFSAIDYILKPVDPFKLINSLKRANELVEKENLALKLNVLFSNLNVQDNKTKKLVLHTEKNIHIVDVKDIMRCESDAGYTTFHLVDGRKIIVSKNLKFYEDLLSNCNFFRPHQSHLINLDYIDHYIKTGGGYIVMKNKDKIPVAQRKKERFLDFLNRL